MTDFQFRLWIGLITQADNLGRGDARPAILKGRLFALREKVRDTDVQRGLEALADNGSIVLYQDVSGRPFYEFPNWLCHQRLRKESSKFPGPNDPGSICRNSPQDAASCREVPQNVARREEKRREVEVEVEVEEEEKGSNLPLLHTRAREGTETPELYDPELSKVMTYFLDRINPMPSTTVIEDLTTYTQELGADVVCHALGIASDERKSSWRYIRAILQRYVKDGLKTMDDVLRAEQEFEAQKGKKPTRLNQPAKGPLTQTNAGAEERAMLQKLAGK